MRYEVDLLNEVVLLIDADFKVVDAFKAEGKTSRYCAHQVSYYAYRKSLTLPEHCLMCGKPVEDYRTPCFTSGGFHAFVGLQDNTGLPQGHLVENRSVPYTRITFEELDFFLERDQLFPAAEIAYGISV